MECPRFLFGKHEGEIQRRTKNTILLHQTIMRVVMRLLSGLTFLMEVEDIWTVEALKKEVGTVLGIPADQQRYISRGRGMEDGRTMADYAIVNEDVIWVVLRLRGGPV